MKTEIIELNYEESKYENALEIIGLCDQAREAEEGCQTWKTKNGATITTWPNGRAAVGFNGDSLWGNWNGATIDMDNGTEFNVKGELI